MKQQSPQNKPAPTGAQLSVIHGAQSAGQAAFISLCVGIGQYLITGNISVPTLLTVLGSAFFGAGTMVYKSLSANPQLAQAALDTANEALQKVEQVAPWIAQDIARMQQIRPAQQPVSPPAMPIESRPTVLTQAYAPPGTASTYQGMYVQPTHEPVPPLPATAVMPAYNLGTGQNMPPVQRGG